MHGKHLYGKELEENVHYEPIIECVNSLAFSMHLDVHVAAAASRLYDINYENSLAKYFM